METTIGTHLGNFDFKIDTLTEELKISRRQLFRKIKRLTGFTPNQYLVEARLQRARGLLESGEVGSVKEARLSVGIKSAGYFSEKFKGRFGVLPSVVLGND